MSPRKGWETRTNGHTRVPVDVRLSGITPKAETAGSSWWLDCDDAEFTRRAKQANDRMHAQSVNTYSEKPGKG